MEKDAKERQRRMRWNVTWGRMAERRGTDLKRMTSRSEAPNVWQSVPGGALAGWLALARPLVYFLLPFFFQARSEIAVSSYTMHASSPCDQ